MLGYRINEHDLFEQGAIEFDNNDLPCAFHIDGRSAILLARVGKLRLLLPDTSSQQGKLDYVTRADLGRERHLRKGVTLTLRARSPGRGARIVEATIDRKETLAEGPFAGQGTVLVEPDLEMIRVVDNRRKPRVRARRMPRFSMATPRPSFRPRAACSTSPTKRCSCAPRRARCRR